MNAGVRHRRRMQLDRWKQRILMLIGALMLVVAGYTLIDYYQFTKCQETVNQETAHVDEVRGEAFERSIDAQIMVAETLLHPQRTTPEQGEQALARYRDSLIELRKVREAFERPEPRECH
jgi:hypothetical protein